MLQSIINFFTSSDNSSGKNNLREENKKPKTYPEIIQEKSSRFIDLYRKSEDDFMTEVFSPLNSKLWKEHSSSISNANGSFMQLIELCNLTNLRTPDGSLSSNQTFNEKVDFVAKQLYKLEKDEILDIFAIVNTLKVVKG